MSYLIQSKSLKKNFLYIVALVLLASCANIKAPTGGEKDTTPPRIDTTAQFTPNFQTNFQESFITLPFDEWVVLKDVVNEVVISPPLEKPLDMKLKKRTVIIDFSKETLRENTTYTINFGESIQDLNEGNFQKNFRYIFSTGDVIDSLEVSGTVIDALTALPIENVLVVLYDDLSDSAVHKERPYYFAKTNANGQFNIPFVKQDTFNIFALKDENANYKYDLPNEQIAFFDEVIITGDTILDNPTLRFFTEKPPLKAFSPQSPHYGYIPIVCNTDNLDKVKVEPVVPIENLETLVYVEKDTLKFWYNNVDLDSLNIVVFDNENLRDTFTVRLKNKASYLKSKPKVRALSDDRRVPQNPDKPIRLSFNKPISTIDISRILMLEDTTKKVIQPQITTDTTQDNVLIVSYKWKENKPYELIFADSSLFDFQQLTNDTIRRSYMIQERSKFGSITVTADSLDAEKAYVIQILTDKNEVVKEFYAKGKRTATQKFLSLDSKDYKLRVIVDSNENQRWDTGDYPNSQPEKVIIGKDITTLRPNWELDLKILLTD